MPGRGPSTTPAGWSCPTSQQHPPLAWSSRQGKAVKALEKLAGPHVPVSLKQLQKAVAKAKAEYDEQLSQAPARRRARPAPRRTAPSTSTTSSTSSTGHGEEFDEDLDDFED